MSKKILVVFGTRPEAIKMAPLVHQLKTKKSITTLVCVTAQHREMLDQVLEVFDIVPDYDLNLMTAGQSLNELSSKILIGIDNLIKSVKPDLVLVHGDTTTSVVSSLAACYNKVHVAHIEAGLRSGNRAAPWPEEINRILNASMATLHFAPTPLNQENLLQENVELSKISVTGNTVIDALYYARDKINQSKEIQYNIKRQLSEINFSKDSILLTTHRRENLDLGLEEIFQSVKAIAQNFTQVQIIFPVHKNPIVRTAAKKYLSAVNNVKLLEPLDYLQFTYLMSFAKFILTDSGGIQEEAPALGKKVLVMRDVTERVEAVTAGTIELIGTKASNITEAISRHIENDFHLSQVDSQKNPYGDGFASQRIVSVIEDYLTEK